MISYSACLTASAASLSGLSADRSPYRRMRGGSPEMKCRSEPRFSSTSIRSESTCGMRAASGGGGVGGRARCGSEFHLGQHAGVGHELLELALLAGVVVGVVRIDGARRDGPHQRLVEQLHAEIALRPWPSGVFTSTWVTTASRLCARKLLVCSRSSTGSASMMRSMVLTA